MPRKPRNSKRLGFGMELATYKARGNSARITRKAKKMARSDKLRDVGRGGQIWSTGVVTFRLIKYYPITDQWSCHYSDWYGGYDGYIGGDSITSFMSLLEG